MNEKTCTSCQESKPLSEYSIDGKRVDGSVKYRAICKKCNAAKTLTNRKAKKSMITSPLVAKGFTVDEMAGLKELLNIKDQLLVMTSTPSTLSTPIDKGDLQGVTLSKTFKVYQSVLDRFNHYIADHQGEKIQDIVSMALLEYIDNH